MHIHWHRKKFRTCYWVKTKWITNNSPWKEYKMIDNSQYWQVCGKNIPSYSLGKGYKMVESMTVIEILSVHTISHSNTFLKLHPIYSHRHIDTCTKNVIVKHYNNPNVYQWIWLNKIIVHIYNGTLYSY